MEPTLYEQDLDTAKAINQLAAEVHQTALEHGWWRDATTPDTFPRCVMLICCEAAEAVEAHRKRNFEQVAEELADIILRTLDVAQAFELDIGLEVVRKAAKNVNRPYKHGNRLY